MTSFIGESKELSQWRLGLGIDFGLDWVKLVVGIGRF